MIEVEPHRTIDLARYGWARDLLLTFGSIGAHAQAEALAVSSGSEGAPEARLNLLLLLCAAEQVAADHLVRGGLDLSAIRRVARVAPAVGGAMAAAERTSEELLSLRAATGDRETVARVEVIRGLALAIAESMARAQDAAAIDLDAIASVFAGVEPDLANARMKIPSCFRAQDLTPADCFELAARFAAETRPLSRVLVVGVRTSGSYMAPLVAGWLRAAGVDAIYTTTRPKAPFIAQDRKFIKRFRNAPAVIVDDPPMTGASYLRTAGRLEECGVARQAITFLVPLGAESALDAEASGRFATYRRVELPHADFAARRDLSSPGLLSFLGQASGRPGARVVPVWPADEVERRSGRRHLKQVYDVEGAGRVHVKGVGVGWLGYPARHVAEALRGRVPETLGFWGTFMATREEPEGSTPPAPQDIAAYIAARARLLRVATPRPATRFQKDGPYRLAKVLARVHGPLAPLAVGRVRRMLTGLADGGPSTLIDGRMGLEEWLGGSPPRKRDFEEHAFDKDDLGLYDPAYDLAGAVLELGPGRDLEQGMLRDYIDLSGDDAARDRMSLALLLCGAYSLERYSWEVEGQRGTPGWQAAVQAWLKAEAAMTWAVDRLLADSFPGRREGPASSLWSIDVDGVLEDAGLGFPATTPAGALALQTAGRASAAMVLNSGRSLAELALRCDALRLDGAVAEYGSAIWDAATGLSESLLEADDLAALEKVRSAALAMPDVHLDLRYTHSVRVRQFAGGRPRALGDGQVARLVEAGSGRVKAVQGIRQTDIVSASSDKRNGLERLRRRSGWRGDLFAIGDSESDVAMARAATRAYAPRHRDDGLAGYSTHLRADRQRALLEAVRREHPARSHGQRVDSSPDPLVRLLGLRDAPRPWRALRAFGPGLLEVFRT